MVKYLPTATFQVISGAVFVERRSRASRSGRSEKARGHEIPDHVGERLLRTARDVHLVTVRDQDHRRVVRGAEGEIFADLVDDEQITALAGEFGPPVGEDVV